MSLDITKNFSKVTVSTGYNASATSIALTAGQGANLPNPAIDGAFNLVWWNYTDYKNPADDPSVEIVRCTARSTDTLTVTRAQESTSASTKNTSGKSYRMVLALTKKMIDDINTAILAANVAIALGIKKDGTTTTTAPIPFVQGIKVDTATPPTAGYYAVFGDTAQGDYMHFINDGTHLVWEIYDDNDIGFQCWYDFPTDTLRMLTSNHFEIDGNLRIPNTRTLTLVDLPSSFLKTDSNGVVVADTNVARPNNGIKTVLMGDSITERNGTTQAGWTAGTKNTSEVNSLDGYFEYLNALCGAPFRVIRNSGVAGNTTTQMLTRFSTDVLAYSPSLVSIMGGINDAPVNITAATTIANIKSMIDQSLASGALVIVWTITPKDGSHAGTTPLAQNLRLHKMQVNQWIRDYCRTLPNALVIDTEKFTSENTTMTGYNGIGGWLSGYSSDGTHPSSMTAIYNMATPGIAAVQQRFRPTLLVANLADTFDGAGSPASGARVEGQNLLYGAVSFALENTAGLSFPGSGTINNTPPFSMYAQLVTGTGVTLTITNPPTPDGTAKVIRCTTTATASGGTVKLFIGNDYLNNTTLTIGKYYEFSGQIEIVSGHTLVGSILARLGDGSGLSTGSNTNNHVDALGGNANINGTAATAPQTLTFRGPRYLYNGEPIMVMQVTFDILGAGTSVVDISRMALREYSTLQ